MSILKEQKNYAYYYDDLKDQDDMLHAAYDFYKNHGINKTKVDNTNYIDLSKNDDDAR